MTSNKMTGLTGQSDNLHDLQVGSVKLLAGLLALLAYGWMMWVMWPEANAGRPAAWAGGLLLALGAAGGFLLHSRWLAGSAWVLILSSLLAVAAATISAGVPDLAYFFVLPVIAASLLLSPRGLAFASVAAAGLLGVAVVSLKLPAQDHLVWLPMGLVLLVALVYWFSARSYHLALVWMWMGYEQADRNERLAIERQAELRQVLKSLDDAYSRLERAHTMLAVARDQAEEARRLKQQFAQTISHELRTPLNIIVGFTELMTQSPEYYGEAPAPAYLRDLAIVYRNARHLQDLVSDVLDLARIEAAEMTITREEIAPKTLVGDAVATAHSLVESRGLALQVEMADDLPPLWVDPMRIRQVLFNLLNNAVRFTESGGVTIEVTCRANDVLFTVRDTGMGIPQGKLEHIFEEFQQIDGSTRRRHGGAGLGLAICRRFVELHEGHIWAESEGIPGRGSAFHFALPDRRSDLNALLQQPLRAVPSANVHEQEKRILVAVTRSPAAGTLLTRYLHDAHTVIHHNLETARQAIGGLLPQAVIIDTNLIPMAAGELQALAAAWDLPDATFLAGPLPGESSLSRQLNVDGYLIKPVSRHDLWDALRPLGEQVDRILLVDDDHDFVRLLGRIFDSPVRRYQYSAADSGTKGLEMIAHQTPDVVLLDINLPDMDGAQFLTQMRAHPEWARIPVIVVSGQEELPDVERIAEPLLLARTHGLLPADLVRWAEAALGTKTSNAIS